MSLRDVVFLLVAVFATAKHAVAVAGEPRVVGWIEAVIISPENLRVLAKVDTGAQTSSLNAPRLTRFERGGVEWVSFTITNRRGETARFERPIVRTARIRRHNGRRQERPVVMMRLCLGGIMRETEVNLIDRSGFNYQMLIGRRFMDGRLVVDPSRTFRSKPNCKGAARS